MVVVTKQQSGELPDKGAPHERYREAGLVLDEFRRWTSGSPWASGKRRDRTTLAKVQPGDALVDMMGREWAIADVLPGGFHLEDPDDVLHRLTWHALLTLGEQRTAFPGAHEEIP